MTTGNLIEGNFIGTDSSGETTIDSDYSTGNGTGVLLMAGATANTVGRTTAAAQSDLGQRHQRSRNQR